MSIRGSGATTPNAYKEKSLLVHLAEQFDIGSTRENLLDQSVRATFSFDQISPCDAEPPWSGHLVIPRWSNVRGSTAGLICEEQLQEQLARINCWSNFRVATAGTTCVDQLLEQFAWIN